MGNETKQRLRDTALFRFIKTYPRISAAAGVVVAMLLVVLPGSGQDKLTIILRTVALGFLIALGFYCFKASRH